MALTTKAEIIEFWTQRWFTSNEEEMLEILWHSTVALNLGHTAEISKELKTKIYCRSHPQSPILTFAGYTSWALGLLKLLR